MLTDSAESINNSSSNKTLTKLSRYDTGSGEPVDILLTGPGGLFNIVSLDFNTDSNSNLYAAAKYEDSNPTPNHKYYLYKVATGGVTVSTLLGGGPNTYSDNPKLVFDKDPITGSNQYLYITTNIGGTTEPGPPGPVPDPDFKFYKMDITASTPNDIVLTTTSGGGSAGPFKTMSGDSLGFDNTLNAYIAAGVGSGSAEHNYYKIDIL